MPYKYKALKIKGRRVDEHRYVMEQHLGRRLLRHEIVRHKDKDTRNNVIENLYLITRQQQFQDQLASGELSKSILDGLARKAKGIKLPKKKKVSIKKDKPIKKIDKAISRPFVALKKEKPIFKTKKIDTSESIAVRIDHKTIIYCKKGTDIERLKAKYKKPAII